MTTASKPLGLALLALAVAVSSPVVAQPISRPAPAAAAPAMTAELLARLLLFVGHLEGSASVDARLVRVLGAYDGSEAYMPVKLGEAETATDGAQHYVALPADPASRDVLFVRKTTVGLEGFLTDRTGNLRAAAFQTGGVAQLITNERAAAQYASELALFARETATDLSATGELIKPKP